MNSHSEIELIESVLLKAASQNETQQVVKSLMDLFWRVAEIRHDMPHMLTWLGGDGSISTKQIGGNFSAAIHAAALAQKKHQMAQLIADLISHTVIPWLPHKEASIIEEELTKLVALSQSAGFVYLVTQVSALLVSVSKASQRVGRLTADVHGDCDESYERLNVGTHTGISFQRTLRVPEDGREYLLPANMGSLPIYRIEDYADTVPPHWLDDGGFFIPLYQREALYIAFTGASWRPSIAKVAVGNINAITGKPYNERILQHEQDYVVIPDQKWLDGINTGKNVVSQFVAMPFNEGYTIEEQMTDESLHGGFQITVFEPSPEHFPMENPDVVERRRVEAKRHRIRTKLSIQTPYLRSCFLQVLGDDGITNLRDNEIIDLIEKIFSREPSAQALFMAGPSIEMGIAFGGLIKQQIFRDRYGAEPWDSSAKRLLNIRIVNSAVFQRITGELPPSSPVTLESYRGNQIPWFESYDEVVESLAPARRFSFLKSIAAIVKNRGAAIKEDLVSNEVDPSVIERIQTLTHEERIMAFLMRAESCMQAGQLATAFREATMVLGLTHKHGDHDRLRKDALNLRARCGNKLQRYRDAEEDVTESLQIPPFDDYLALLVRSEAYLGLEEFDLAIHDACEAINIDSDCPNAYELRAEAYMRCDNQEKALHDCERALDLWRQSCRALAVRAEIRRLNGFLAEAVSDLTRVLDNTGIQPPTLCARAKVYNQMGNQKEAVADLKVALSIDPNFSPALQQLKLIADANKGF